MVALYAKQIFLAGSGIANLALESHPEIRKLRRLKTKPEKKYLLPNCNKITFHNGGYFLEKKDGK